MILSENRAPLFRIMLQATKSLERDADPTITHPALAPLSEQVRLDVRNRMIGEVLADLGHDPLLDVLMKGAAQVGERARRRDNDQCRYGTLAHQMLQCGGDAGNEAILLQTVQSVWATLP